MDDMREKLIAHINRKDWWHVPPGDPKAYEKRGKFYASSFREAEFWGRALDEPHYVRVANPLIGDEESIERALFGRSVPVPDPTSPKVLEWRWKLDARMKKSALAKGYDDTRRDTVAVTDAKASGSRPCLSPSIGDRG